jgi:hypothetical protein
MVGKKKAHLCIVPRVGPVGPHRCRVPTSPTSSQATGPKGGLFAFQTDTAADSRGAAWGFTGIFEIALARSPAPVGTGQNGTCARQAPRTETALCVADSSSASYSRG